MARIALVGTGLVGRAWAISFARAGHEVRLYDESAGLAEKAVAFAAEMLPMLAAEDLLDGQSPGTVAARLRIAASLEEALAGVVHVQESTPENLEIKKQVFARLDRLAPPDAVLASSTSAILPSLFTETLA
ncbi:MAG TPA: 3-hydroxyacyl-CoA dehydrogenase NAD-binding domain-containing protein, partial [Methylomirabilota bacterium]|nr:3-hydroxyacyl-CoA dehydrogenase NAD-binding domain-containing protein [Methylomirabilota bacterium]